MDESNSQTSTRWQRIEELFHRAQGWPAQSREEQVRLWCADDPALLTDVLRLIEAERRLEQIMAEPRTPAPSGLPVEDRMVGEQFGEHRIVRVLGAGGMGTVYLAERKDERMVQHVAIKVMYRHLQGSPAVHGFELERQALARLEHPNVARLLGGGVLSGSFGEATPYLMMEYIEGRRLDVVADDPATTLEARVNLMLQLCAAVAYVHRNLILHRDLKPGNVMVTEADEVKLLDFGTMKLMDAQGRDSAMTRAGMRSLTMRYSSPEYIRGEAVTTASDVYSLGMVLYRMLAGRLPPGLEGLAQGEYLERLASQNLTPAIAGRNSSESLALDLKAITAKALEYESTARYQSVESLAADLRNALDHRPVSARAGNAGYRLAKFYRRHRTGVLGAAAIVLAIAAGLTAIAHEARLARAETQRADAGIADERGLVHALLFNYFEELKRTPGSTNAQQQAVQKASAYLDRLNRTKPDAGLLLESVDAYTKLGNLQGNPYEENLGDSPGAVATLTKAVTLSQELLRKDPGSLTYLQAAALAEMSLGRVYFGSGDPHHALEYLRPAAETSERISRLRGVDAPTLAQAASVLDTLGDLYGQEGVVNLGESDLAIANYRIAQAIDQAGLRTDAACARCRRGIAMEYWKLGTQTEPADAEEAIALYRQGLATLESFSPEEQKTTRVARLVTVIEQRLGILKVANGATEEGVAMLRAVRLRFKAASDADPTDARARFDLVAFDISLAEVYDDLHLYQDALATDVEERQNMQRLLHEDAGNHAWQFFLAGTMLREGLAERQMGDPSAALVQLRAAHDLIVQLAQEQDASTEVLYSSADLLVKAKVDPAHDPALALACAQRAFTRTPTPSVLQLNILAAAQLYAGQTAAAQASARSALALLTLHPRGLGSAKQLVQARRILAQ